MQKKKSKKDNNIVLISFYNSLIKTLSQNEKDRIDRINLRLLEEYENARN